MDIAKLLLNSTDTKIMHIDYCTIIIKESYRDWFINNRARFVEQLFEYNNLNMCAILMHDIKIISDELILSAHVIFNHEYEFRSKIICTIATFNNNYIRNFSNIKASYYICDDIDLCANVSYNHVERLSVQTLQNDAVQLFASMFPNIIFLDNHISRFFNVPVSTYTIYSIYPNDEDIKILLIDQQHDLFSKLDLSKIAYKTFADYMKLLSAKIIDLYGVYLLVQDLSDRYLIAEYTDPLNIKWDFSMHKNAQ